MCGRFYLYGYIPIAIRFSWPPPPLLLALACEASASRCWELVAGASLVPRAGPLFVWRGGAPDGPVEDVPREPQDKVREMRPPLFRGEAPSRGAARGTVGDVPLLRAGRRLLQRRRAARGRGLLLARVPPACFDTSHRLRAVTPGRGALTRLLIT